MLEISEEELRDSISIDQPNPGLSDHTDDPNEAALAATIDDLWQDHEAYKSVIKQESQTLRALRAELGERLFGMKQLLARPGRGGQWSAWLAKRHIPRATADRLVQKHEQLLNPNNNCLTDATSEPTGAEIKKLLDGMLPKLRRVLRTPNSVGRFLALLEGALAETINRGELGNEGLDATP